MKTFRDVAQTYQEVLSTLYSDGEARQLFLMAYTSVTGKNRSHYLLNSDKVVDVELQKFQDILTKLQTGRPIQQVIGVTDFYTMQLQVNEHTLIPRPETEELVEWIVSEHKERASLSILDVGTGSGCIALALKKHLPQAQVDAVELHAEAIAVARANATNLGLSVNFIHADILEWDSFIGKGEQYDIIVSNPPYITPAEQAAMHDNVLLFEPHSALFVEEHAPLLFYATIADMGMHHLSPNGALYFEINQYLSQDTRDLLKKKEYRQTDLRQDLNRVDRMLKARR